MRSLRGVATKYLNRYAALFSMIVTAAERSVTEAADNLRRSLRAFRLPVTIESAKSLNILAIKTLGTHFATNTTIIIRFFRTLYLWNSSLNLPSCLFVIFEVLIYLYILYPLLYILIMSNHFVTHFSTQ